MCLEAFIIVRKIWEVTSGASLITELGISKILPCVSQVLLSTSLSDGGGRRKARAFEITRYFCVVSRGSIPLGRLCHRASVWWRIKNS